MEQLLTKGMCRDYGSIKDKQRSQDGANMRNFFEVGGLCNCMYYFIVQMFACVYI